MSSIITLKGNSIATLQTANNIGSATQVQVTNTTAGAITLTVATVGTPNYTFPGTIVLAGGQTILLEKGPTDTITGGTVGQLVATAVSVTR